MRYEHGSLQVNTSGFKRVNAPYRPNELITEDWSRVFTHGIDSLWQRPNGRYLVVEDKGRIGAPSKQTQMTYADANKSKIPPIPARAQLTEKQAQLWRMLHDNSDKGGAGAVMQMSDKWIQDDIRKITRRAALATEYARRVYLVSEFRPTASGINGHLSAISDAFATNLINHRLHGQMHGVSEEYLEQDIVSVQEARRISIPFQNQKPGKRKAPPGEANTQRNRGNHAPAPVSFEPSRQRIWVGEAAEAFLLGGIRVNPPSPRRERSPYS